MLIWRMDHELLEHLIYHFNENKKNRDRISKILIDAFHEISKLREYDVLVSGDFKMACISIYIADSEGAKCSWEHLAEEFEHTAEQLRKRGEQMDLNAPSNDDIHPVLRD
jgi:hypothetical protein